MYDVWMRILASVEGSVLWLPAFNASAMKNLKEEASKRNVDPSRIIFAPVLPLVEHHARHALADLFLDTFPYNAHGTASLSLRSGVPIVTMSGETMASRVAGSLLRELDLPDLITRTPTDYEMLAVRLATNPTFLDEVKSRLQVGLKYTDLFSGQAFARKVEKAYAIMMERQLAKRKPYGFKLNRGGSIWRLPANDASSKLC
jgi:predicted O-linked N-acetylglucosamine transferase (SPINDLY family)